MLVRGFDVVPGGRFPHLLIEHLEGPTLRELIDRDGALPLEQLLPLGLHVASALHYLAAEGMVHLDVKPDNVVMGAPPRLIDLSVARTRGGGAAAAAAGRHRRLHGAGAVRPVAWSGRPPADVFGLAATLHHAVSGERPFARDGERRGSRSSSAMRRRCRGGCLRELASLLGAALARDPGARPSAAEFAAGLEPLVAGDAAAVRARPPWLAAALTNVNCGWVGRLGSRPRGESGVELYGRIATGLDADSAAVLDRSCDTTRTGLARKPAPPASPSPTQPELTFAT